MSKNRLPAIIVIAVLALGVYMMQQAFTPKFEALPLPYSSFIKEIKAHTIKRVIIDDKIIKGESRSGDAFFVYAPHDSGLINDLLGNDVEVRAAPPPERNMFLEILISWLPMFVFIGVWIFFMRRQSQSGGGLMGKSKHKLLSQSSTKITFADVAGCDEAKSEVVEIVDFLKDPKKFSKLGGKIPRGVLLVGPPGTGKTMLAKAVAGEAGVSFFSISGSDFVEMFVGVGASRVRDMFEEARKQSPCIIFIDEIDAIGKARTNSMIGNDERDQTLNALLVEMDGFEASQGIIIVAATNRPEILDKALLRPGRFDRQVTVGLPDILGREQILEVHTKDVPLAADVKLHDLARGTPGFSGAELANLVNEASILASKCDRDEIHMRHFEKAKDKILMGAERKTFAMSEDEKRLTAYHEAGHAVVGYLTPEHDPIYKVSIIPRGRALGITMFLPERDSVSMSKRKLEGQIASLYGGRIAEEIVAGADGVTTGASNDIERATVIATRMVTEWGMSPNLKPIKYVEEEGGYVGAGHSHLKVGLDEVNNLIEKEIEDIIQRNYDKAYKLVQDNWDKMEAMVEALMRDETIDNDQIEEIMKA
jgi:cell division protease FtsH